MIPALLLATSLAVARDDAADVRAVVDRFFALAAKKDGVAAKALWVPASPQFAVIGDCVSACPDLPRDVVASDIRVAGDEAEAWVRFKGRLTSLDDPLADETHTHWRVELRREDGRWHWWNLEPGAVAFGRDLAEAADVDARKALFAARKTLLGRRVIDLLHAAAADLTLTGDPETGSKLLEISGETAEAADRDDLRAQVRMVRGIRLALLGKPGEALGPLRAARDFGDRLKDPEVAAMSRAWLGYALQDAGEPAEALKELGKALEIATTPELVEERFCAENFSGMARGRLGFFADALRWHERAAATARGMERADLLAQALNEAARTRYDLGDFGGALATALEGLTFTEAPADAALRAKLLNTAGLVYLATADYPLAEQRFLEALELWTALKLPRVAGILLNNLGELHRLQKRYADAEARLLDALKILEEAQDAPMTAIARGNLGLVQFFQGKRDAAAASFRRVVADAGTLERVDVQIGALLNLGELHLARDAFKEAFGLFEEARALAEQKGGPAQRFVVWLSLGLARLRREGPGDLAEAVEFLRRAAAALEGMRAGLRDPVLQQGFLSQHAPLYGVLAGTLLRLGRDVEAFAAAEEGKARTLADLLEAGAVRIAKSLLPEERAEEERREARLRALAATLEGTRATDDRLRLEAEIAKGREGLDEFRRALFARRPGLQGLRGAFAPAPLEELNRRLLAGPSRAALLSYLIGHDEILLFVLRPGKETAALAVHRLKLDPDVLRARVEAFWTACATPGGDYAAEAKALHRDLVAPAGLKDVDHLILVPDGFLNRLPFQALMDVEGRHLIEAHGLAYAPSATALLRMEELAARRKSEAAGPFLALGAPEMPPGFGELEHAKRELEALAKRKGTSAVTGTAAAESKVKPLLEKAGRIHVATHGKVDEAAPLYSYVVLARDGESDGLLYAREIVDLDLRADLVVLSACETALGKQVRGEGVVGLTWALFAAGTPATALSQWQVADESTGALMAAFHEALDGGAGFAEALRRAQRGFLRDPRRAHPYSWAPFILVGAAR